MLLWDRDVFHKNFLINPYHHVRTLSTDFYFLSGFHKVEVLCTGREGTEADEGYGGENKGKGNLFYRSYVCENKNKKSPIL